MARVLGVGGVLTEVVGGAVRNGLKGWFGIGKGKNGDTAEDEDIMEKFLKSLGGAMDGLEEEEEEEEEVFDAEEEDAADEDNLTRYGIHTPWVPHLLDGSKRLKSSGRKSKSRWWLEELSEEAESKYLTMSWWLLHVGWKDVGERVRRAVEEVFDGYVFIFSFIVP